MHIVLLDLDTVQRVPFYGILQTFLDLFVFLSFYHQSCLMGNKTCPIFVKLTNPLYSTCNSFSNREKGV